MFLALLVSISATAASVQKTCDTSDIKKVCDSFLEKKNEPFITLGDGFKWKPPAGINATYQGVHSQTPDLAALEEKVAQMQEVQLDFQTKLLGLLNRASAEMKISDRFKMSVLGQSSFIFGQVPKDFKLAFPANVNDETAKLASMTQEQAQALFQQLPKDIQLQIAAEHKTYTNKIQAKFGNLGGFGGYGMIGSNEPAGSQKSATDPVAKNKARVDRLFEMAKESIIASIAKGRTQLSLEEQNFVDRVRKIKLIHGDIESVKTHSHCANSLHNAFYKSSTHSAHLCPSYYEQSDLAIIQVLGHEIGHSLDPCHASMSLIEKPDGEYALSKIELSDQSWKSIHPPILTDEKVPFNEVRDCLVNSRGLREVTEWDIETESRILARKYYNPNGPPSPNGLQVFSEIASKNLAQDKRCVETSFFKTETNEAMADFYGVMAANHYMKSNSKANLNDIMSLFVIQLNGNCTNLAIPDPKETMTQEHPVNIVRTSFFLEVPAIAGILNCRPPPEVACFSPHLGGASSRKSPPPSRLRNPTPATSPTHKGTR
jgi:hypothetical protein